jgi:hypothetical protein
MKWVEIDDDDIPLAQLKKSKYGVPDLSLSLSPLEIAALSLTQLQHAAPAIGPVQEFLVQPFHQLQGRFSGRFPQPANFASEAVAGVVLNATPSSVSDGSRPSSPASVAVQASSPRRLSRAPRGRRHNSATAVVSHSAVISQSQPDSQEEGLYRPPPHA